MSDRRVQTTIPEPYQDVRSLRATCMALKELVEVLAGQRGDGTERAVTVTDVNDRALAGYVSEYFASRNYAPIPMIKNWTPNLFFGGANAGIAYGPRIGRSCKVGPLVTLWFDIALTNKGTSTGSVSITGFLNPGVTGVLYAGSFGYTTNMLAGVAQLAGYLNELAFTITAPNSATSPTAVNTASDADFTNTSRIIGTVQYETDS